MFDRVTSDRVILLVLIPVLVGTLVVLRRVFSTCSLHSLYLELRFILGSSYATLPMPNVSEFTGLYDQYRIDYVECKFSFSNNNSSNSSPGSTLPIMYLVKDYDDSGAAGVTDLQQYSTQTMWQLEMPMDEMA